MEKNNVDLLKPLSWNESRKQNKHEQITYTRSTSGVRAIFCAFV